MSGSQPVGRTLLGFNQVPQYPTATASPREAQSISKPAVQVEPSPPPSDTAAPAPALPELIPDSTTETATSEQDSTPAVTATTTSPAAEISDWEAKLIAQTEAQEKQRALDWYSQAQPAKTASLSPASSPQLVDYSNRGKRKPPASAFEADGPPNAHHARRRSSAASTSSKNRPEFLQEHGLSYEDDGDRSSNLRKILGRNRDPSSSSLPDSPARTSRRGYVDEVAGQDPHAPRDLLAEASRMDRAGSGSEVPPSIAEQDGEEPSLPPGLALATDSPSMRSRRGVLLKSSQSQLTGRRNRRRGSSSIGDGSAAGDAASTVSQELSTHSSSRPAVPEDVRDEPSLLPVDDAASAAGDSFQDADNREGDEAESVIFQAGSALSHESYPSDDAGSGKVQGSQALAADQPSAELESSFDQSNDSFLGKAELSETNSEADTHENGRADSDSDDDDDDDDDDEGEDESLNDTQDSQAQGDSSRRGIPQTTLHAPLFTAPNGGSSTVAAARSPSSSFSAPPPPIPARRVRATPPTASSSVDEAQQARDEADRRRKLLELNRKLQAERAEWEKHILSADWEELEVARYLNQFGKHVHAVRGTQYLDAASFSQPAFPARYDWTTFPDDGSPPRFNAFGYSIAWATAFLSYISPSRMADLQQAHLADEEEAETSSTSQDDFRWGAVRASSERLYLAAMPLYEALGSKLRHTWRWESKLHSLAYMVTYTFLWWRGLLTSSAIFGVIMLVLSLKTYPPKPDALREILARQKRREEEARRAREAGRDEDDILLAADTPSALPRSKYSLAVEATRKYGMQTSVVAGALADGHEKAKNFALWRSPRATWRLLFWLSLAFFVSLALKPVHLMRLPGAALGIVFFIIGPIAEYKPHWLGVEWTNPLDWVFAGVPNDAQYSMEILRGRASQGKPLISDTALLMRPDIKVATSSASQSQEGRVDWTRWADAVMRGKSLAITGSEILSGSRALNLPRLPVSEITASTSTSSALLTNITKGLNRGLKAIEDRRNNGSGGSADSSLARQRAVRQGADEAEFTATAADQDGTYWCVYDGVCGHLVVTPKSIVFRSLFAKRPRGRRGDGSASASSHDSGQTLGQDQPLLDPQTGDLTIPESSLTDPSTLPKVKVLLEIPLDRIVGLKKITDSPSPPSAVKEASTWTSVGKRFNQFMQGEGGLQVVLERRRNRRGTDASSGSGVGGSGTSDVETFLHIVKRDEAFNRLLALTPRQWTKVY